MIKRLFGIFMIVLLISHAVSAGMIGELSGVLKPESVQVSGNEFYVVEGGWEASRKWAVLEFPEYFPPIQDITVIDGIIYVQTYEVRDAKGDAEEYVVKI